MCVPNSPLFQHCQVYDWPPFFNKKYMNGPIFLDSYMKGPIFLTSWYMHIFFAQRFFAAAYPLGITWTDCDICVITSKKWVQYFPLKNSKKLSLHTCTNQRHSKQSGDSNVYYIPYIQFSNRTESKQFNPDQTPQSAFCDKDIQSNLDSSNTDGSFTMANSNSFSSPYEVLPIAQ